MSEEKILHYGFEIWCEDGKNSENVTHCWKKVTCRTCLAYTEAVARFNQKVRVDKELMRCSVCRETLMPTGFTEVSNHPCEGSHITVKWTCSDHPAVYWDTEGNMYTEDWKEAKNYTHINGFYSAFQSMARQIDVETYKHDEDKYIKLTKKWALKRCYSYTADLDGNVLSRKGRWRWMRDNCYHTLNLPMFLKNLGRMLKEVVRYQITGESIIDSMPEKRRSEFNISWELDQVFSLGTCRDHEQWGYRWSREVGHFLARYAGIKDPREYGSYEDKRELKEEKRKALREKADRKFDSSKCGECSLCKTYAEMNEVEFPNNTLKEETR